MPLLLLFWPKVLIDIGNYRLVIKKVPRSYILFFSLSIQCDVLASMAVILEFLINKIENNEMKRPDGFKITTTPSIPLDTISALVSEHYNAVNALNDIRVSYSFHL